MVLPLLKGYPWLANRKANTNDDIQAKMNGLQRLGDPYSDEAIAAAPGDGGGNEMIGASDLSNDVWLYGGNIAAIKTSIARGRNGVMPAFGERLDDTQVKLLVAWLTRPLERVEVSGE